MLKSEDISRSINSNGNAIFILIFFLILDECPDQIFSPNVETVANGIESFSRVGFQDMDFCLFRRPKKYQSGNHFTFIHMHKVEHFLCHFFAVFLIQVIQHQTVKYDVSPLSPLSKHRLSKSFIFLL